MNNTDNLKEEKTLKEERTLTLSTQEWKNFQSIINTPKKPTQAFKELMNLESFE